MEGERCWSPHPIIRELRLPVDEWAEDEESPMMFPAAAGEVDSLL